MTLEEAFSTLDHWEEGVPEAAIQCIREQPTTPALQTRLVEGMTQNVPTSLPFHPHEMLIRNLHQMIWYVVAAVPHAHTQLILPLLTLNQVSSRYDVLWDRSYEELVSEVQDEAIFLQSAALEADSISTGKIILDHIETLLEEAKYPNLLYFSDLPAYLGEIPEYVERLEQIFKHRRHRHRGIWAIPMAAVGGETTRKTIQDNLEILWMEEKIGTAHYMKIDQAEYQAALELYQKKQSEPNNPKDVLVNRPPTHWPNRLSWLKESRLQNWL